MEEVTFMTKTDDYSAWSGAKNRLIPEVWPEFFPSFKIDKNDKIFTIGSCFARNIEDYLANLGYNIPMKSFFVPKEECPNLKRPNGILNKFSPTAIFQEINWCDQIYSEGGNVTFKNIEKFLYICSDELVIDTNIGCYAPVLKKRALKRRQEIYDVFSQIFSSQVVIMTLGLIEAWYDLEKNIFIQRVPNELMKNDRQRFKFIRLNYHDCYDYIQKSISLVRKYNPAGNFLITTSPIPLKLTFTNDDVIIANTYSKSVLRAVCGEIVEKNKLVDYFPSFESATLTKDWSAYKEDLRQIDDTFIKKIVDRLAGHYF
jgi:hypothetical protein